MAGDKVNGLGATLDDADETIQNQRGAMADPQLVASMAINDVIELARAMSPVSDFSRGAVEMRRRLAVMDAALLAAERAGSVIRDMAVEGNA